MNNTSLTYNQRIDLLRARKMEQTSEKQRVIGAMDHDDFGSIRRGEEPGAVS